METSPATVAGKFGQSPDVFLTRLVPRVPHNPPTCDPSAIIL